MADATPALRAAVTTKDATAVSNTRGGFISAFRMSEPLLILRGRLGVIVREARKSTGFRNDVTSGSGRGGTRNGGHRAR